MNDNDEDYTDHSAATIVWQTDPPNLEIIARLRESISKELGLLEKPGDLMFHHFAIRPGDWEGPSVILSGNRELNAFDASYYPEGDAGISIPLDELPKWLRDRIEADIKKMEQEEDDDDTR